MLLTTCDCQWVTLTDSTLDLSSNAKVSVVVEGKLAKINYFYCDNVIILHITEYLTFFAGESHYKVSGRKFCLQKNNASSRKFIIFFQFKQNLNRVLKQPWFLLKMLIDTHHVTLYECPYLAFLELFVRGFLSIFSWKIFSTLIAS